MSFRPALLCLLRLTILVGAVLGSAPAVRAATLEEALARTPASELFQGADAYGAPQGSPAMPSPPSTTRTMCGLTREVRSTSATRAVRLRGGRAACRASVMPSTVARAPDAT